MESKQTQQLEDGPDSNASTDHVIAELLRVDTQDPDSSCPVARFLDALDGPWATLIVRELLTGPKRFGELQTSLSGISPKALSARLKKLASFGILTRAEHDGALPKVEYELTAAGLSLAPILYEMATWADLHLPSEAARPPRPRPTPRRVF